MKLGDIFKHVDFDGEYEFIGIIKPVDYISDKFSLYGKVVGKGTSSMDTIKLYENKDKEFIYEKEMSSVGMNYCERVLYLDLKSNKFHHRTVADFKSRFIKV